MLTDLDTGKDLGASDIEENRRSLHAVGVLRLRHLQARVAEALRQGRVVLLNQCYQDPKTKQFHINIYAAPNRIPRQGDIPRVVSL